MIVNRPFINYSIKSSHNSYIFTNYQVSMTTIMKSFFGFRNDPTNDNSQLNNHIITLLKNNFKFFEFDLTNNNGNIVIQHTTNIQGKNVSVSKSYDFQLIMKNLVGYLNNNPFDTPIFIYLECSFDNDNYNQKLSNLIKTIFYRYLLDNPNIDYTKDSPFDIRFKNKIIFVSNRIYKDESLLSSNVIEPSTNVGNSKEIFNFAYSNSQLLNNYSNTLKRVYVENVLTTINQPFIKNCNIFSINYLPNDRYYIEYNKYMNSGYVLLN